AQLTVRSLEDRTTPVAGTMDLSFGGGDGIVKFNLPGYYAVHPASLAALPDGKILLAGLADSPSSGHAIVLRLNADGSLDTSYGGGDGYPETQFGGQNANFTGVAVGPDGKAVATGSVLRSGQWTVVTVRFNADGAIDPTFGTDGFVITDFTSNEEGGTGVV